MYVSSVLFCRSYASGICGAFTAINMFGATKLYPYFLDILGFYGTFWMYGGVMFIEVIYGALSINKVNSGFLVQTHTGHISKFQINQVGVIPGWM